MFRVTIADFLDEPLETERAILGDVAEVVALGACSEADLDGRLHDTDALVLYHVVPLRAQTLSQMPRCRLVVRGGVGVDNVDLEAARSLGIPVANVPDYGTEEVADTALAMALALARGTHQLNSHLQHGPATTPWSYTLTAPRRRLRGSTFGIVGCGRIGTATALRARAFGFDVAFHDPFLPDGTEKALAVRRARSLDELLTQSHILSLHCPLTDTTRHLINPESLQLLPSGAILINTSRGAVVDTLALPDALASGQLDGAGIDVLDPEPPPPDHPLVRAWHNPDHPAHHRLILNPHSAFYSTQALDEIRTKSSHNIRQTLLGHPPFNVVN